jgi:hypothetical protein
MLTRAHLFNDLNDSVASDKQSHTLNSLKN